jgi:hypothetical protein
MRLYGRKYMSNDRNRAPSQLQSPTPLAPFGFGNRSLADGKFAATAFRLRRSRWATTVGGRYPLQLFEDRQRPRRSHGATRTDQSRPFSARNLETRSAIWTLFKSENAKCVLPLMPISGRCTSVTSPPCLLTVSRHARAICSRARQLSCAGRSVGVLTRRVVDRHSAELPQSPAPGGDHRSRDLAHLWVLCPSLARLGS